MTERKRIREGENDDDRPAAIPPTTFTIPTSDHRGFLPSLGSDAQVVKEHRDLLEAEPSPQLSAWTISDPLWPMYVSSDARRQCCCEVVRNEEAHRLYNELNALCGTHGFQAVHVFTAFVFESVLVRSRLLAKGISSMSRTWVGDMDVGVVAKSVKTPTDVGKIVAISKYVRGEGRKVTLAKEDGLQVEVPAAECEAVSPISLDLDPFLPCGEIVDEQHCPNSVKDICVGLLYSNRKDLAAKMKQMTAWGIADQSTVLATQSRHRLMRRTEALEVPIQLIVTTRTEGKFTTVSLGSLEHMILTTHFAKLRTMFLDNGHPEADFLYRVFALLCRYHSLAGGTNTAEREAGWQCAIPPNAMRVLQQRMGCSAECYASPLNAYMRKFCSAFPDTDCFFGSQGSFYTFRPSSGSFEVGPPYDRQVIGEMFTHIVDLLEKATGPLSFTIVLPYSERAGAQQTLDSVFKTPFVSFDSRLPDDKDFAYVDGYQHCDPDKHFLIRCPSRMMVLQNPAGKEKWPPEDAMKEFINTWAS